MLEMLRGAPGLLAGLLAICGGLAGSLVTRRSNLFLRPGTGHDAGPNLFSPLPLPLPPSPPPPLPSPSPPFPPLPTPLPRPLPPTTLMNDLMVSKGFIMCEPKVIRSAGTCFACHVIPRCSICSNILAISSESICLYIHVHLHVCVEGRGASAASCKLRRKDAKSATLPRTRVVGPPRRTSLPSVSGGRRIVPTQGAADFWGMKKDLIQEASKLMSSSGVVCNPLACAKGI